MYMNLLKYYFNKDIERITKKSSIPITIPIAIRSKPYIIPT